MINSRDINDLHPKVKDMAEAFLSACEKNGLEVAIYSTYRDNESQNDLYAQGRTKPGNRVTNAKGGDSFHNWKVAFDAAPKVNGKIEWGGTKLFKKMGEIGESVGLEWGGRWKKFPDMPHFQFTGGLTLKDFKEGKTIDD